MNPTSSPLPSRFIVGGVVLTCLTLAVYAPIELLRGMNSLQEKSNPSIDVSKVSEHSASNRATHETNSSTLLTPPPIDLPDFEQFLKQLGEQIETQFSPSQLLPVNKTKLYERILAVDGSRKLTEPQKIELRASLPDFVPTEFLDSLKFVHVDQPQTAPETRVVQAIGSAELGWETREWKFWFAPDGDTWKVFDWQRIDQGVTYSERQSKHHALISDQGSSAEFDLEGFEQVIDRYTHDVVRRLIRSIEAKPEAASQSRDFDRVRTAYFYLAIRDYQLALECGRQVTDSKKFPGAHRAQQLALFKLKDYHASIQHGQSYLDLVRHSPDVSLWLGLALHATGKPSDGDDALAGFFKYTDWSTNELREFIEDEGEVAFPVVNFLLEHLETPLQFAVELPHYPHTNDYDQWLLEKVVSFAEATAPEAAETAYLKGELAALHEDQETAYSHFQLAMNASVEPEQKNKFASAASRTLLLLGRMEEAYDVEPKKSEMIVSEYWARRNTDSTLSESEWTRLLLHHLKYDPNDHLAVCRLLEYLIANGELGRAEQEIRHRFEFWKPKQKLTDARERSDNPFGRQTEEPGSEENEFPYEEHVELRDVLPQKFAQVMVLTGRFEPAYEEIVQRSGSHGEWLDTFFVELADVLIDLKKWDSLTRLLEMHRQNHPNDPNLFLYQGHLAAHHEQLPEAVASFENAIRSATDKGWPKHFANRQLLQTLCENDTWLEYYRASPEKSKLFYELEIDLPDEAPEQLERLIAEHIASVPVDKEFAVWMVRHESEKLNPTGVVEWLGKAAKLNSDSESTDFIVDYHEKILARIHVRNGNYELARELTSDDPREKSLIEALIDAHQQKHSDAAKKLLESGPQSLSGLADSSKFGWDIFRPEYRELQRRDSFDLESFWSTLQWVVYLKQPVALDSEKIAAALQEGLQNEFKVIRIANFPGCADPIETFFLESVTPPHTKWYVQFQSKDSVDPLERVDFIPEAVAADNAKAVIVVGRELRKVSEFFSKPDQDTNNQISKILPSLETLAGEKIAVWHDVSQARFVLPSSEWKFQKTTNVSKLFRQHGVVRYGRPLGEDDQKPAVQSNQRDFYSDLRLALRTGDLTKLRVRKTQRIGYLEEPMWLTVQSVDRVYNDLELQVSVLNDMALVPQIKTGLPCKLKFPEIDAWQVEGQGIIERLQ
ncbi:MAG: hypothetical protein JNL67_01910 [Planctomycetaceae bacterium]|nr:hypothetical protein [Planctomycetaceae bacterium]